MGLRPSRVSSPGDLIKPAGATHRSCRTRAKAQGVSKATVNRMWQSHHRQPHRAKSFKLSRDPKFLEKLTDVVGLYLNPPEKALALCVDEENRNALGRASLSKKAAVER